MSRNKKIFDIIIINDW